MEKRANLGAVAWCLCGLLLLATVGANAAEGPPVTLKGEAWTVTIEPRTLHVTATPASGVSLELSGPQEGLGAVAGLQQTPREARWQIPEKAVTATMRLEGDVLEAQFEAQKPGEFTWPLVRPSPAIHAFILPTFEGVYVPAEQKPWIDFMVERGAMNTTADLSMPFWGIDCAGQTLTYILTNPFGNELSFSDEGGRLSARLTHAFMRNWKVKQYGLRICLGAGSPTEPARQYRKWLQAQGQLVSLRDKIAGTPEAAKLLGAAHIYLWGDGISAQMLEAFAQAGFDRLWLGAGGGWQSLKEHPDVVGRGKVLGYLIGAYDSYDSIHRPGEPDTWESAQFDVKLYETGAVVKANGQKKKGFQQKGYTLSPIAARSYVERRVSEAIRLAPVNSVFIDCDAFGDLYDDFSPEHPATQEDDMRARLDRMAWVRDTYGAVIGSEGGSAYAASTIHFAHGMMTPVIGWGDPDLKDRASAYFLGGWWPPTGPAVFLRPVPLKEQYKTFYFDPRYRLPLYETVFHDSVVATHQWGFGSLKFRDEVQSRALLEVLYGVPPLYHMNLREFATRRPIMQAHYAFFSPLHRQIALLPLTGFTWLTADRLVQRTTFGADVEVVANFGADAFSYEGQAIPGHSALARWLRTGEHRTYTPPALEPAAESR